MPFDAGSIVGSLDLSTVGFQHGITEAHTHAESGMGHLRELFEGTAAALGEVLGAGGERFTAGIESAIAGFAEGPALGTLNAAAVAVGAIREMAEGGAKNFDEMHLAAERTGTDVEWLSRTSNIAHAVGLSLDNLVLGFKTLEQQAALASEGNKAAEAAFKRVGLSAQEAAELSQHPQEMWDRITESLGKMTVASDRNLAAKNLLGKQGMNLVPLLTMERDEYERLGKMSDRTGATVTESQAKMGASFGELESVVSDVWQGLENKLSTPILQYLSDHLEEIEAKAVKFGNEIGKALPGAATVAAGVFNNVLIPAINGIGYAFQKANEWGEKAANSEWWGHRLDEMGTNEAVGGLGYNPYDKSAAVPTDLQPHSRAGEQFGSDVAKAIAAATEKQMDAYHSAASKQLAAANLGGTSGGAF